MTFIQDKEQLKPGLIIFRRGDVAHRNWYCRIKLPQAVRYKTYSLQTNDINTAKEQAFDHFADVRAKLKNDIPVFNRPFRDVAREYWLTQDARAKRGEISEARAKAVKALTEGALDDYVGSTQIHLIGDELWGGYPAWRRTNGIGLIRRNGVREVSGEMAAKIAEQEATVRARALRSRGITEGRALGRLEAKIAAAQAGVAEKRAVAIVSDATIHWEMAIFGAVMNYAIKKRYAPASQRYVRPKLKTVHRDAFTREEYRALHSRGRAWVKAATTTMSQWYRAVTYNFALIAANTGMRPPELRNLRWCDLSRTKDRLGNEIMAMSVRGKGKARILVAPISVWDYFERIRKTSKATKPTDPVFTTITGKPSVSLYGLQIEALLTHAQLRVGPDGTHRSAYTFRHTYATFRLQEGVDVYFLAEQMGTSVQMIEQHYGHVNTIKHADRVLMGMAGWDTAPAEEEEETAGTKLVATKGAKARLTQKAGSQKRRR